jgi:integrase/recombinase XerD
LNLDAQASLTKLSNLLDAKSYSFRTARNYIQEMRLLFAYYNDLSVSQITQSHIFDYLNFIKREHGVGRDKCRMCASACSFFFRYILPTPYVIPKELYPRKEFRLPDILSVEQMDHLLSNIENIKHRAIIALLYGTGLRLGELRYLQMSHIQRADFMIKVVAGKGNKDRFTLLPKSILDLLGQYYRIHKPKKYLFEGQVPGVAMNDRSIQHAIRMAMIKAGFEKYKFSAHSLRHSFATHLLDSGSDIHTIKELLGHSKIETTMIYLHLSKHKREQIVSPLDTLLYAGAQ